MRASSPSKDVWRRPAGGWPTTMPPSFRDAMTRHDVGGVPRAESRMPALWRDLPEPDDPSGDRTDRDPVADGEDDRSDDDRERGPLSDALAAHRNGLVHGQRASETPADHEPACSSPCGRNARRMRSATSDAYQQHPPSLSSSKDVLASGTPSPNAPAAKRQPHFEPVVCGDIGDRPRLCRHMMLRRSSH